MFDLDRWQEIFSSIRSNVLRTVLSGFTVALGLFIFIVLFGIGTGLQNAFTQGFARDAQNLISIVTGKTTIAYNGLQSDRTVTMNNDDYDFLVNIDKEKVGSSTPRYTSNLLVKYGKESGNYQINGAKPEEQIIENRKMLEGRYLTPTDLERKQNVAVIGRMVQRDLIKNGNPVGKELDINGTIFKVVGVFSDDGGDWDERHITVPITTLQQMKKGSDTVSINYIAYNDKLTPEQAIKYGDELKSRLKARKNVAPDDENGIRVWNNAQNMNDTFAFMAVLTGIVGFIGLGTLAAGIIGISNIMVYIVKERTKEIGIRRALGAKPSEVRNQILLESVVITLSSGLLGFIFGIFVLMILDIATKGQDSFPFYNPTVNYGNVFAAMAVMVVLGLIIGMIPAQRAVKIRPIEALRTE
ncbi:MAG TPA: ABC transporter ATP-binding protein [Chryseobacterium sp.]|nr:ABC transporter ATP-binding protein [Chryseobacterium sp.]